MATKTMGQIAFEARWAMNPSKHSWCRISTIDQLRWEEAAAVVIEEFRRRAKEVA